MHPLIHILESEIGAYRLFTIAALVASTGLAAWIAHRGGLGWRTASMFLLATLTGALVGARLFAAATAADPFFGGAGEMFALRFGNMAIFGGIGGAAIGGWAVARWTGEPAERLADMAAPAIALGIVLLRTGCLLAGCCFGKETDLAWAITYPEGSLSHLHQRTDSVFSLFGAPSGVHPIPVYEMLAGAVLLVVALWLLHQPVRQGTAFSVVVGGYALVRLSIQPLRAAEPGNLPSWFDPAMFSLVAFATAAWLASPLRSPFRSLQNRTGAAVS